MLQQKHSDPEGDCEIKPGGFESEKHGIFNGAQISQWSKSDETKPEQSNLKQMDEMSRR